MMELAKIAKEIGAQLIASDKSFEHLSTDTRRLQKGDLFLALRGEKFDGHDYVKTAMEAGAVAAVVDHRVTDHAQELNIPQLVVADTRIALGLIANIKRRQFQGKLVAVTGSCGKTTVKGLLKAICEQVGSVLATEGNYNNQIGVPLTLMNLDKQDYGVIEAGMNTPGEIAYLCKIIEPDITLVNNVHPVHVENFGSLDGIAEEKGSLYREAPAHAVAVINLDNDYSDHFIQENKHRHIIGFSHNKQNVSEGMHAFVSIENIDKNQHGVQRFNLLIDQDSAPVNLQLLGEHNVNNALAAAATAHAMGISIEKIVVGLENYSGDPGRMQLVKNDYGICLIDDTYNANPSAFNAAIDYLSKDQSESWLVAGHMGELGELSEGLHRQVGEYAAEKKIKKLFCVGPFASAMADGFGSDSHFYQEKNQLIEALLNSIKPGISLLVKGSRNAHMEDIITAVAKGRQN